MVKRRIFSWFILTLLSITLIMIIIDVPLNSEIQYGYILDPLISEDVFVEYNSVNEVIEHTVLLSDYAYEYIDYVDGSSVRKDEYSNIRADIIVEEPNSSYDEKDLYYLAAAVCMEAASEPDEIQLLVANVIINRVNSTYYPDTIKGVLTQYKQYGGMWKYGISFPKWATDKIKERCYKNAKRVLEGERFCPENVLYQAEFTQGVGIFKEFDGFYFCYYD